MPAWHWWHWWTGEVFSVAAHTSFQLDSSFLNPEEISCLAIDTPICCLNLEPHNYNITSRTLGKGSPEPKRPNGDTIKLYGVRSVLGQQIL